MGAVVNADGHVASIHRWLLVLVAMYEYGSKEHGVLVEQVN